MLNFIIIIILTYFVITLHLWMGISTRLIILLNYKNYYIPALINTYKQSIDFQKLILIFTITIKRNLFISHLCNILFGMNKLKNKGSCIDQRLIEINKVKCGRLWKNGNCLSERMEDGFRKTCNAIIRLKRTKKKE